MTDFKLRRPCPHCPFRTDVPGYLRRGRAIEIATAIAQGAPFPCHETTDLEAGTDEETGEYTQQGGEQFCAGALIMMEHQEAPNQLVRIAENLGVYEAGKLDMEAPVHTSVASFIDHHSDDADLDDEDYEPDCCEVVGPMCEAPAGFMVGGMAIPADNEGVELHECPRCGRFVCDSCSNDDGVCEDCSEEEEAA